MIFITYQVIVVVIVSIKSEASQFAYLIFFMNSNYQTLVLGLKKHLIAIF